MPPGYETPLGARPGDLLLVVHHFDARGSDELTLRRGDRIELLELDEGFGDGWYLGRHVGDNRTGIFPGVFTTIAPRLNVRQEDNSASDQSTVPSNENNRLSNSVHPDEATPQPSRHVSMAETISPTDSLGRQQALKNERSWPTSQTGSAALSRGIQRTISETMQSDLNGEDSPVLNETLSVIDEHITDFNTPRQSVIPHEQHNDSGSEYSSHIGHRISYIPGTETDEEEENDLTENEVRRWDPKQTAQHLREMGVESKHCDIFEEEEITGDVLLEMDQEFIFMKEFNFGVMGKRLKTWHKIKAFQEELQGVKSARQSVSQSVSSQPVRQSSGDFRSPSRAGNLSFLPRIPSVNESHRRNRSRSDTSTTFETMSPTSSPTSFSQMRKMSSPRPSADSIRRNNHRRHSSIETDARPPRPSARMSTVPGKSAISQRGTVSSFDRNWTMTAGEQVLQSRPGTALGTSDDALRHDMYSGDGANGTAPAIDPVDLDRGYFSGGELDSRRSRNLLKKRESTGRSVSHSRKSSAGGDQGVTSGQHGRFGSDTSAVTSVISPAPQSFKDGLPDTRIRTRKIASTEVIADRSYSPTVTNLERTSTSTVNFFSSLSPLNPKQSGDSGPSPTSALRFVNPKSKFRRAIGLRAISDAVTGNEKSTTSSPTSISAKNSLKSSGRTDSITPSAGSKSFEADSTDSSLKGADGTLGFLNRPKTLSNRTKSKKDTSAYIRGLEKKTPQEQIVGCDYYGWMKKKSSNLMATWKPRLFVLRGRRLSYYYSENDTEERGLIDISSHRVFRADQDTITALHATLTGAKATPSSSSIGTPDAVSPVDTPESPASKSTSSEAPFIFKLVPPKAGSPRGVQFTKPAIHYFQVDNIQQGRLWMAALMKATIDRDLNLPVRTTNKQKTVSLRQARNMGHRPPALMEEGEQPEEADENGATIRDSKVTEESPASSDFSGILALKKLEGIDIESSLFSDTTPDERPSSS